MIYSRDEGAIRFPKPQRYTNGKAAFKVFRQKRWGRKKPPTQKTACEYIATGKARR